MKIMFQSNGGRVCCDKHLGTYGTAALASRPNAKRIVTPLDVWHRMNAAEIADWAEFLAEYNRTEMCEDCDEKAVG